MDFTKQTCTPERRKRCADQVPNVVKFVTKVRARGALIIYSVAVPNSVPVDILPVLTQAKVGALSIEFANPRHQHEYAALKKAKLPPEFLLLPGVIDSKTNFVEHPEVVANRICEAVDAIGDRSRVIASVDCGFGTFAGSELVAEDVVWAKLGSCREGADIATRRLWGKKP